MKLIVGLGNPGLEYQNTRHNAGFMVIDRLAKAAAPGAVAKGQFQGAVVDATLGGERCLLLKPATYMNRSGQSVADAVRFYKLTPATDLLVVVDDIYLAVGQVRMKPSGGDAGHNGLASVRALLGTDAYPRLRVGVGAKPPMMDQADWVLSRFTDAERPELERSIDRAARACEVFASRGLDAAMNTCNAPVVPASSTPPAVKSPSTTDPSRGEAARASKTDPARPTPGPAHQKESS